ncbi:hypothetical protein SDC9_73328 [bioreactor metagenome]|uniref:Transmembrane protein n=1 Tax=bioreactor metagenome TaxID=1076179 RepID=A0A644YJZ4_9ZZZZ
MGYSDAIGLVFFTCICSIYMLFYSLPVRIIQAGANELSAPALPGTMSLAGLLVFFLFGLGFGLCACGRRESFLGDVEFAAAVLHQRAHRNNLDDEPANHIRDDAIKHREDQLNADNRLPDALAGCHQGRSEQRSAAAGDSAEHKDDDRSRSNNRSKRHENHGDNPLPPFAEHVSSGEKTGDETDDHIDRDEVEVNGVCDARDDIRQSTGDRADPRTGEHTGKDRSNRVEVEREFQQGRQLSADEVDRDCNRNQQQRNHAEVFFEGILLLGFHVLGYLHPFFLFNRTSLLDIRF